MEHVFKIMKENTIISVSINEMDKSSEFTVELFQNISFSEERIISFLPHIKYVTSTSAFSNSSKKLCKLPKKN